MLNYCSQLDHFRLGPAAWQAYKQLDRITVEDTARCYCLLVYAMARLQRPHAGYLRRLTAALTAEAAAQHRGQQAQQQQAGGEQAQQQEGRTGTGPSSSSTTSSNGFVSGEKQQLLGGLPTQQLCLLAYSLASVGCTDGQVLRASLDVVARRGELTVAVQHIAVSLLPSLPSLWTSAGMAMLPARTSPSSLLACTCGTLSLC